MADSCRDIFREILYSYKEKDLSSEIYKNYKDDINEDSKGIELEVMRLEDLVYIMDEQLPQSVDENQKMAMTAVL